MSDARLRDLERKARQGDPEALRAYHAERERAGDPVTLGGVPSWRHWKRLDAHAAPHLVAGGRLYEHAVDGGKYQIAPVVGFGPRGRRKFQHYALVWEAPSGERVEIATSKKPQTLAVAAQKHHNEARTRPWTRPNPPRGDERMRDLERRAAHDPAAASAWITELRRRGASTDELVRAYRAVGDPLTVAIDTAGRSLVVTDEPRPGYYGAQALDAWVRGDLAETVELLQQAAQREETGDWWPRGELAWIVPLTMAVNMARTGQPEAGNPPRGDERLRDLERRARQGDPEARAQWIAEGVRVGDQGALDAADLDAGRPVRFPVTVTLGHSFGAPKPYQREVRIESPAMRQDRHRPPVFKDELHVVVGWPGGGGGAPYYGSTMLEDPSRGLTLPGEYLMDGQNRRVIYDRLAGLLRYGYGVDPAVHAARLAEQNAAFRRHTKKNPGDAHQRDLERRAAQGDVEAQAQLLAHLARHGTKVYVVQLATVAPDALTGAHGLPRVTGELLRTADPGEAGVQWALALHNGYRVQIADAATGRVLVHEPPEHPTVGGWFTNAYFDAEGNLRDPPHLAQMAVNGILAAEARIASVAPTPSPAQRAAARARRTRAKRKGNPDVWRVEDADGRGPMGAPDAPWVPDAWRGRGRMGPYFLDHPDRPYPEDDFERFEDTWSDKHLFGFPTKEAAEAWFGEAMPQLREHGYDLYRGPAAGVVTSSSGKQVMFRRKKDWMRRRKKNPDDALSATFRDWQQWPTPENLGRVKAQRERAGLAPVPGCVAPWDAMQAAWPTNKKGERLPLERLTTGALRDLVKAYLQTLGWGWAPDMRSDYNRARLSPPPGTVPHRGGKEVWITADLQRRVTFGSKSLKFEKGGRGHWERDDAFEGSLGKPFMQELFYRPCVQGMLNLARLGPTQWTDARQNPPLRQNACDDVLDVVRDRVDEALTHERQAHYDGDLTSALREAADLVWTNARDDGMHQFFAGTPLQSASLEDLEALLAQVVAEWPLEMENPLTRGEAAFMGRVARGSVRSAKKAPAPTAQAFMAGTAFGAAQSMQFASRPAQASMGTGYQAAAWQQYEQARDRSTWPPVMHNPDERLRDLERKARQGDLEAQAALEAARARVGVPNLQGTPYEPWSVVWNPYRLTYDVVHERTGKLSGGKCRDHDKSAARAHRLNIALSDEDVIYAFLQRRPALGKRLESVGAQTLESGLPTVLLRTSGFGGALVADWRTLENGMWYLREYDAPTRLTQKVVRLLRKMYRLHPPTFAHSRSWPNAVGGVEQYISIGDAPDMPYSPNPALTVMGLSAGIMNPSAVPNSGGPGEDGNEPPGYKQHKVEENVPLEDVREAFPDEAELAEERLRLFHGTDPASTVKALTYDDGKDEHTYKVVVALGQVPETHYVTPDGWEESNKKGYHWVHEHPPGKEPYEVLDPETGLTSKIGGTYRVPDWWRK